MISPLIAALAALAAIGVITVANPVHAILCLILVFIFSGISLALIGADFLALLYVLVYIGAIAVLFLFVIMCLGTTHRTHLGKANILLSFILWAILCVILKFITKRSPTVTQYTYTSWDQLFTSATDIETIGQILFFFFPLPVIFIGLILLIALIGAIVITLTHSTGLRRQDTYPKEVLGYNTLVRELQN